MRSTFALVLFVSCLTGFLVDADDAAIESCIADNNLTKQDVINMMSGIRRPSYANDNLKCAAKCALVKDGFMDNNGELRKDQIVKYFSDAPKEEMESAVAACSTISGANTCDRAFQTLLCMEDIAIDLFTKSKAPKWSTDLPVPYRF